MTTMSTYAQRTAQGYLTAWQRDGGVEINRGPGGPRGLSYWASRLNKVAHSRGLPLPGDSSQWWGDRYRQLAENIA